MALPDERVVFMFIWLPSPLSFHFLEAGNIPVQWNKSATESGILWEWDQPLLILWGFLKPGWDTFHCVPQTVKHQPVCYHLGPYCIVAGSLPQSATFLALRMLQCLDPKEKLVASNFLKTQRRMRLRPWPWLSSWIKSEHGTSGLSGYSPKNHTVSYPAFLA